MQTTELPEPCSEHRATSAQTGTIWVTLEDAAEAAAYKADKEALGAAVRIVPRAHEQLVDAFVSLHRHRAPEILGHCVDDEEWLERDDDDVATALAVDAIATANTP